MIPFIRAYIVTMRPYLLFVSGIVGIAGLALAPPLSPPRTILIGAAFFLTYGFGQALTDVFQTDTDRISSPYRPLVRGVIRPGAVVIVSLAGLCLSGALFASCNRANIPLGAVAILGLATYTPFKRRWWGGPFYNAWIVAVLFAIGFLCGGGEVWRDGRISLPFAAALATVFFGYAGFVLVGYGKDVTADAATGYRTIPVVWGYRVTAAISIVLAIATIAACATAVSIRPNPVAVPFGIAGATATIVGAGRLYHIRDERDAHRAIVPGLHGYVLLLIAVAVAARPGWMAPLALYYGAFALAMSRRPVRGQV